MVVGGGRGRVCELAFRWGCANDVTVCGRSLLPWDINTAVRKRVVRSIKSKDCSRRVGHKVFGRQEDCLARRTREREREREREMVK